MRRLSLAAVSLIALSILTTAQASAAPFSSGTPKCESKRQHFTILSNKRIHRRHAVPYATVAANDQVRVYRSTINFVERRYYVCAQNTGRAHFIGRAPNNSGAATTDLGLDLIAITPDVSEGQPTYVALRTWSRGDLNYDRFLVFDVKGKRVHDTGKLTLAEFDANDRTALALTSNGAIAYEHLGVLFALDAAGTRMLAGPASGAVDGVTAAEQTVYWTQGGAPHSVTLG